LAGSGLTETSSGMYTLASGDPATVTKKLDSLVFAPTPLPSGVTSMRTTLELSVSDSNDGLTATDNSTTVTEAALSPPPPPSGPPVITGTIAAETVASDRTIAPFSTVAISDAATSARDMATISLVTNVGGLLRTISDDKGFLAGSGLTETSSGMYTLASSDPATLTKELDSLVFTPTPLPSGVTSVRTTLELSVSNSSDGQTAADNSTTVTEVGSLPPPPPLTSDLAIFDPTTGQAVTAVALPYTGPVSGLQEQYINIAMDSLNISASSPNWFIHSGSGNDALAVSSGINVLDGGTGSNFLTGGSGTDSFFVDDRAATADIWSTVNNFHAGDAATIWGVTPSDFSLAWVDGQGAAGFTGLTLHATAAGRPTASLTLAGFSRADMASGRVSVSFGADPASGSAYVYVHANS
jgi:RTX calcium-binding nonapeptide repeat (4 copies)